MRANVVKPSPAAWRYSPRSTGRNRAIGSRVMGSWTTNTDWHGLISKVGRLTPLDGATDLVEVSGFVIAY